MRHHKLKYLLLVSVLLFIAATGVSAQDLDTPDQSFLFNTFSSVRVADSFALATTDYGLLAMSFDADRVRFTPLNHLLLPTQPSTMKVYGDVAAVRSWADVVYLVDMRDGTVLAAASGFNPAGLGRSGKHLRRFRAFRTEPLFRS